MKHWAVLVVVLSLPFPVQAKDLATARDAVLMVDKAVRHIEEVGPDRAYADFTNRVPDYVDRDLYVIVYDFQGRVLAHGQLPELVGRTLIDERDASGKAFVRERVRLAHSKDHFWQDYTFTDPVTKQVLPKVTYCRRVNRTAVCAGVYQR